MSQPQMPMDPQQLQAAMLQMQMAQAAGMAMPPPDPSMGAPPQVDPAMVQAYTQMFQSFQAMSMGQGGLPGVPPMPFGASPYAVAPPAPAPEYCLSVSVEGMKFQYQLTEDDIRKVFSRYGGLKHIKVDEAGGSAFVTFMHLSDAQSAQGDLNGKVLNGLDGTLRVSWVNSPAAQAMPPPYPGAGFPGLGFPGAGGLPAMPGGGAPHMPHMPMTSAHTDSHGGGQGGHGGGKGERKYTCRFLIGIDNDKEFQVARRIIGAKGANMKRIVQQTEAKLRLRGRGSGYLEGAGQKESSEPLQLCISCTSAEGYRTAVRSVENILKRVYEEYSNFCEESGLPVPDLQMNFSENQLVYSGGAGGGGVGEEPGDNKKGRNRRARGGKSKPMDGDADRGEPGPNAPGVEEIEKSIDERNEARRAGNYMEADRIRQMLQDSGVALMDEPGGRGKGAEVTTWRYWRE